MFFRPKVFKATSEEKIRISDKFSIVSDFPQNPFQNSVISSVAEENGTVDKIFIHSGVPESLVAENGGVYGANSEEYAISIDKEIHIYASSPKAAGYAVITLKQLSDADELTPLFIYDYPENKLRALRIFTPGREQFDDFKRVIDLLTYYKNNVLIMEVGGAMEYKRHPEINKAWEEKAKRFNAIGPKAVRLGLLRYNYPKVGMQRNNGGGSYITQEEMKELVSYCKERGIEVIPEVPSYSHSDYIVNAHPELRDIDMALGDPDTYCPSNPDTYKLLFDILDEITEVFEPSYVHIAHDELTTSGDRCERCRATGKSAARIFADDVIKIYDYLAAKGIKTMMWADVTLPTATGAGYNRKGDWDYIPPRYECRDMLPRDIILVNWHYVYGAKYDDELLSRGYNLAYGNLQPNHIPDWKERTNKDGFIGGVVSGWCPVTDRGLRLWGVYISVVYYSYLYWAERFEVSEREELFYKSANETYRYYNTYNVPTPERVVEVEHALYNLNGSVLADYTAENGSGFIPFGFYLVLYSDGTTAKLPVLYRKNIAFGRLIGGSCSGAECEVLETGSFDGKVFYRTVYENPYPEKNIIGINFMKDSPIPFDLTVRNFTIK